MLTKPDIEKYFIAEKQLGQLFFYIGIAAIIVAIVGVLVCKTSLWKGIAIPLLVIGLIQLIAGFSVYKRSDKQRTDLVYAFDMNPDKLSPEFTRIQAVNKQFTIIKIVEMILFIAAIVLIVLYRTNANKQFLYGIGIALAVQVIIMFAADTIAAKRALLYTQQLQSFLQK